MKTTVEINDTLLEATKQYARNNHKSLKQLIEMSLLSFLKSQQDGKGTDFKLRRHSFQGEGLQDGINNNDWHSIREAIYSGRGE